MAVLKVMSWNIQSISDRKLTFKAEREMWLPDVIANIAYLTEVDLLMIMEVSRNSAGTIGNMVLESLNARQEQVNKGKTLVQEWFALDSEATGKSVLFPKSVDLTKIKQQDGRARFGRSLQGCYYQQSTNKPIWKIRPEANWTRIEEATTALSQLGLLRADQEVYLIFFRCDKVNLADFRLWNSVAGVGVDYYFSGLRSKGPEREQLGYQDPNSSFNGRMPFLVQLYVKQLNGTRVHIPLVVFHAPYGDRIPPRVAADTSLTRLGARVGSTIQMVEAGQSIICADFNVDYDIEKDYAGVTLPVEGNSSKQTYGYFVASGYQLGIRELSTLRRTTTPLIDSTAYRSSAYDNIIAKGVRTLTANIFDFIEELSDPAMSNYLIGWKFANMFGAYKLYHQAISDHLPAYAVIELTTPLPDEEESRP